MKRLITFKLIALTALIFTAACKQTSQQTNQQTSQQTDTTVNEKTVSNQDLKIIEPTIGFTPDISDDAKKNLQRLKELYAKIESTINS